PTLDQARGTLVHAVLERLFDLPAAQRTLAEAAKLVAPQWERLREESPLLAGLFDAVEPGEGREADVNNGAGANGAVNSGADANNGAVGGDASTDSGPVSNGAEGYASKGAEGYASNAAVPYQGFLDSTVELLRGYFSVEDPRRLEPAERECLVEAVVDDH